MTGQTCLSKAVQLDSIVLQKSEVNCACSVGSEEWLKGCRLFGRESRCSSLRLGWHQAPGNRGQVQPVTTSMDIGNKRTTLLKLLRGSRSRSFACAILLCHGVSHRCKWGLLPLVQQTVSAILSLSLCPLRSPNSNSAVARDNSHSEAGVDDDRPCETFFIRMVCV